MALESAPERKPRVRKASALAPYEDYILKRFTGGCHNATQIHKEIVEQAYHGAYQSVVRITQYLKKCERDGILYLIRPPDFPQHRRNKAPEHYLEPATYDMPTAATSPQAAVNQKFRL